jgi:predicted TIM-barrel fold metal-dependent hydrolase
MRPKPGEGERDAVDGLLELLNRYRGRILDAHAHVGPDQRFLMWATPEAVLEVYGRYGIRAGLFSSTISLLAGAREDNWHVLEAARAHPSRILPLYSLNPLEPGCLEELERSAGSYVGVKFHPDYFHVQPSHPLALEALKKVAELGLPLMLHSYDGCAEAEKVARALPELKVVAYHMGGVRWRECLKRLSALENTLVEVSSSVAEPGMVAAAVEELGADRVLFGSDVPYLEPAVSLGKIFDADLSERDLENVLRRNAERLIGDALLRR